MDAPYRVNDDIDVLTSYFEIPGYGHLPVNAFVIHGPDPVLVDTGIALQQEDFLASLGTVIDPADLRWIWLTHTDRDHVGNIHRLLEDVPHLRVITNFLGVGKMSISEPLPQDRVYLINPGQSIEVGGRRLEAVAPPVFDAPETTGLYDHATRTFISSDCFGALLSEPKLEAADIAPSELADGQVLWATIDAPWLRYVGEREFADALDGVRRMDPDLILSSHLPPARGMTERILGTILSARGAKPFVGPDQAALEASIEALTGERPDLGEPSEDGRAIDLPQGAVPEPA